MSIETFSSPEAQAIRSVRSSATPCDHHLDTAEEKLLSDIERFRSHALEQLEHSLDDVLKNIVEDVLGRELAIAPADLQAIIARALRKFDREGPVRLRVAPSDLPGVRSALPVIADSELKRGDLVVEVRAGEIQSQLAVRLSCALNRLTHRAVGSVYGEVA